MTGAHGFVLAAGAEAVDTPDRSRLSACRPSPPRSEAGVRSNGTETRRTHRLCPCQGHGDSRGLGEPGMASQRPPADLYAEFGRRARAEGANVGPWPGLTMYRFTQPTQPRWDGIESLCIGIVAQAGAAITTVGGQRVRGRDIFMVIGSRSGLDCHIVEASPHQPALCLMLEIDPQKLVRSVSANMRCLGRPRDDGCAVSALDDELTTAVLRFLGALSSTCDRGVLAPLHLREMVYRLLQGEQSGRLLQLAASQAKRHPVAAALDYIPAHLAESLTVETLAAQVCLSPSAFSRAFREATGRSPRQYVKQSRLERARHLLDEERSAVGEVSRSVGYTSVSHFIKEFRARFGTTPGDYSDTHPFRQWTRPPLTRVG